MSTTAHARVGSVWLTADQLEVDTRARLLLTHPVVEDARAECVARLEKSLQYEVADGPATLQDAVDNLVFGSLQVAVNNDPTRPKLVWTMRLPYSVGEEDFPGCRYVDAPDRIYRIIGVSRAYRYEVRGRRHRTHPSRNDLSVEALLPPACYGPAMRAVVAPDDIDVDEDGTWTVVADSTPTDGRRNHLHMPDRTVALLVRDTLHDWGAQVPSEVTVRVLDAEPGPERTLDEIAHDGAATLRHCVDSMLALIDNNLRPKPVNTLTPFYRHVGWGIPGGVTAFNRFEIGDDEGLLVTVDPMTADYVAISTNGPFLQSVPVDTWISCLNNLQAQPDEAGTYTFVLSPTDPGVHNWLDTGGLRTGFFIIRWERFATEPVVERGDGFGEPFATQPGGAGKKLWVADNEVPAAVTDIRIVPLADVTSTIPSGQSLVDPEQRKELVAQRIAEYQVRVTGEPITR